MTQDDNGLIYIANNNGVLEYDGENWQKIELPQRTTVRAVAKGADGVIYVGSQSEFGYLAANASGSMEYQSLLNQIPKCLKNLSNVILYLKLQLLSFH